MPPLLEEEDEELPLLLGSPLLEDDELLLGSPLDEELLLLPPAGSFEVESSPPLLEHAIIASKQAVVPPRTHEALILKHTFRADESPATHFGFIAFCISTRRSSCILSVAVCLMPGYSRNVMSPPIAWIIFTPSRTPSMRN